MRHLINLYSQLLKKCRPCRDRLLKKTCFEEAIPLPNQLLDLEDRHKNHQIEDQLSSLELFETRRYIEDWQQQIMRHLDPYDRLLDEYLLCRDRLLKRYDLTGAKHWIDVVNNTEEQLSSLELFEVRHFLQYSEHEWNRE